MAEIRVYKEGELRWVEASGTGVNTWQTGSAVATATDTAAWAARSGLVGFVRAGLAFTDTWNYATVMDRGLPSHHKYVGKPAPEVTFQVLFGITGDWPSANTAIGPSARGVSIPNFNFELKMRQEEIASASGIYYQFNKAVVLSNGFSEAEDGDTVSFGIRALSIIGPAATGYLG